MIVDDRQNLLVLPEDRDAGGEALPLPEGRCTGVDATGDGVGLEAVHMIRRKSANRPTVGFRFCSITSRGRT